MGYLPVEAKKIVNYISKLEHILQQLRSSTETMRALEPITGLKVDLSAIEKSMKSIRKQISDLQKEVIERTPKEIIALSQNIMGLSRERISLLFALIGDKKFRSRDALTAFVGLDLMPRQSGTWRGKGRLSKRGNGYARKLLFQIAWGLKQHDLEYRAKYAMLRAEGKNYKTTLNIIARKFLRYLYSYHFKVDKVL